ncbi:Alpha/Beta hydrolase protein [Gymnopilus junonius]|uniref:triacylglycerol lipase n=1 Tax=Gymnopilus junonius TaxID=109634 RepID=A0A9P5P019_GYMJU|nr:Alpha/Beta hydrolase protein [Gymnopilus junonius]
MLSTTLLLTFLLLPPQSFGQDHLAFASHLQLGVQDPVNLDIGTGFTPSPTYPLSSTLRVKSYPTTVYRPRSLEVLHRTRLRSLQHAESELEQVIWDAVEVDGPDVEDLHTLAQLARMSGNAYALPGQNNWYDVDQAWNMSFPFGWEEGEGFRGHVFQSLDNSTIILSIKGTTLQGPTSKLDKFNDNLLFSCCCARVDFSWVFRTVCDCYSGGYKCDNQCLTDALIQDSLFYSVGVKLIDDLLKIYPGFNVWLVGHSLGGSLASLLGATYGLPAVAFEAPGERLAASRLHLPLPPHDSPPLPVPIRTSTFDLISQFRFRLPYIRFPFPPKKPDPEASIPVPSPPPSLPSSRPNIATTHVYHNADPIPQGTCTGFGSPCAQAGYALETRCHLGQSIVFDTVNKLGWSVDVRKHPIKEVVTKVLEGEIDWDEEDEKDEDEELLGWHRKRKGKGTGKDEGDKGEKKHKGKRKVPKVIIEEDCVDCYKWEFGDFKDQFKSSS